MNKQSKIIIAMLVAVMYNNAQAQKFSYGVQGGVNFAVQSSIGNLYDNDDIKTGFSAGAFANYSISEKIALQTEINYDQKGSKKDNVENNYDYLTVPLLAVVELHGSENTPWGLNLNIGPYASFLLSAETDNSNPELDIIDQVDNTYSSELGVQAGLSVKYALNDQNILLNLKWGMGLTAFDRYYSDPKNKYLGIGLGYEF